MNNPLKPINLKALRTLGELVRSWSIPGALPDDARVDDHTYCIDREKFEQILADKGLKAGEDYILRPNIKSIELVVRREDVFTVTLPEQFTDLDADSGTTVIELPVIYEGIEPDSVINGDDSTPATVEVQVTNTKLDAFLDPYVASYVCSQCR